MPLHATLCVRRRPGLPPAAPPALPTPPTLACWAATAWHTTTRRLHGRCTSAGRARCCRAAWPPAGWHGRTASLHRAACMAVGGGGLLRSALQCMQAAMGCPDGRHAAAGGSGRAPPCLISGGLPAIASSLPPLPATCDCSLPQRRSGSVPAALAPTCSPPAQVRCGRPFGLERLQRWSARHPDRRRLPAAAVASAASSAAHRLPPPALPQGPTAPSAAAAVAPPWHPHSSRPAARLSCLKARTARARARSARCWWSTCRRQAWRRSCGASLTAPPPSAR